MEFKKGRTIYDQIADHINENILTKRWKSGDRIPSVREMAVAIEVNPNTVMRAFSTLQDQGIIINKRGIGYFVADTAYTEVLIMKKKEFQAGDIPHLAKTMGMLGIDFEELKEMLEKYSKQLERNTHETKR